VGVLETLPAAQNRANLDAFLSALAERGYVEGRNLVLEYRASEGHADRFPALADELVRLRVDVIVARGTPATAAAKDASRTIPVVMATMGNPRPIVASFDRPGGNVTGVTTFSTELTAKRVQLLKEAVPGLARIALLHNMGNPAVPPEWEETKAAAKALGLDAVLLDVRSGNDVAQALDEGVRRQVGGVVVGADGVTQMHLQAIVDSLARRRLPAVYPSREFVEAGGLMAYAIHYPDLYVRLAAYVDKLLRGAGPADLPVEQPSKFELVLNRKAAEALGLALPPALLVRADQVIR
jgi:putative ABC transport system substrate-binding protein